jgi:hypothetical protein
MGAKKHHRSWHWVTRLCAGLASSYVCCAGRVAQARYVSVAVSAAAARWKGGRFGDNGGDDDGGDDDGGGEGGADAATCA